LRMRETYEKRMKINEIIFIRTKILWNASVWVPYIWRISSVFSVCLSYKAYVQYPQHFWTCLKKCSASPYASVCHRMRPCLKRIQPMPNVPLGLAYVSVYRRMSDIFYTLAYASTIRNSVTGPLSHDRNSSIWTPNVFVSLTFLIGVSPLHEYVWTQWFGAASKLFMLYHDPISRYSVFTRLRDNLFAESHCW
jgi:hypothetical protein